MEILEIYWNFKISWKSIEIFFYLPDNSQIAELLHGSEEAFRLCIRPGIKILQYLGENATGTLRWLNQNL